MNIENELKLIPTEKIEKDKLLEILKEKGIVLQKDTQVHQEDIYFDDYKDTLERNGKSFRIRIKKDKAVITCKMPLENNAEYKQRAEYEISVPREDLNNGEKLNIEKAIELIKEKYPEIELPTGMQEIITVVNDRNKINLKCPDGSIIEMALDKLQGKDNKGQSYFINPEIEFEMKSGDPSNLESIYSIIKSSFPEQIRINNLSKYARTKMEVKEQKAILSLNELASCAILTQILNSKEYEALKYKGQVLHDFSIDTKTNLDNFRDFETLVEKISCIHRGDYVIPVPKTLRNNEKVIASLRGRKYKIKDKINLEDMFEILLSDAAYGATDEILSGFLNDTYYEEENPITNRCTHSQQVMLGTGLICKSSQVEADEAETLTCMISGLAHDIGHVAFSHIMERYIANQIGNFSHESNGADVINNIFENNFNKMKKDIEKYYIKVGRKCSEEEIEEVLKSKLSEITTAVLEHSRTNVEERGEGVCGQVPREADKIMYVVSDIRDLKTYLKLKNLEPRTFFSQEWIDETINKLCEKKPYEVYETRKKIMEAFFEPLINGNYGRAAINVINTVKTSTHDGKTYHEVDQDLWNALTATIDRAKQIRKQMNIDKNNLTMDKLSSVVLIEYLVEKYYKECNENKEEARIKAIREITKMSALDVINLIKDKLILSYNEIKNFTEDGELPSKEKIEKIKKNSYETAKKLMKAKGLPEHEIEEEAKKFVDVDDKTLISNFLILSITSKPQEAFLKEFKVEDAQLKIIPENAKNEKWPIGVQDLMEELGLGDGQVKFTKILDRYYKVSCDGKQKGITARIRQEEGNPKQKLMVKEKVPKKVSERITRTFCAEGAKGLSTEEMVKEFNKKDYGVKLELEEANPYEEIRTMRMEYYRKYKGKTIIISDDKFYGKNGVPKHQIEIKCPEDGTIVSKIKKQLKNRYGGEIFSSESKLGVVSKEDNGPKTSNDKQYR